jgi:hypothetical protein
MECENRMNTGELLFEMILASMALGPRMSTEEKILDYNQEMLRSSGIVVHDLRTILLDCSRIGGRIIRSGDSSSTSRQRPEKRRRVSVTRDSSRE